MLQCCPSVQLFLPEPSFFCLTMQVPEAPRWFLNPTPLALGKRGGFFLQDPETFPPVLLVKVVPQVVLCPRRPRIAGKGAFSLVRALQETGAKYLWNVFRLTGRQTVPVNLRLCPMHLPSVRGRGYHSKFYSAVRSGDPPSQPLPVHLPPDCAPLYHRLL